MSSSFHSIPTLIPSICFFISFTLTTLLHITKFIKLKRKIYLYLFTFSILRTCLFAFRIAWSPNPDSLILEIISNVLLLGGFFVILEALCILLEDWLLLLIEKRTTCSLPNFEHYSIKLLKLIAPIFSIIGAFGEIFEQSESKIELASSFRQASSLGFLCLIIIYIMLVFYFALKYGESAIRKQLKALVILISASLLLIELVYRTFTSFSHETSPIYTYEWVFYVFECIPEIALLLILGEVILGEWFYSVEDDNKLKVARQVIKLRSKGIVNILRKSEGKDGLESSSIIVVNIDDDKLPRTNTINTVNTINTTNTTNTTNNTNTNSPV